MKPADLCGSLTVLKNRKAHKTEQTAEENRSLFLFVRLLIKLNHNLRRSRRRQIEWKNRIVWIKRLPEL